MKTTPLPELCTSTLELADDDSGANTGENSGNLSRTIANSPNYSLLSAPFSLAQLNPGESIFCHHAGLVLVGRQIETYLRSWSDPDRSPLLRQFCAQLLSGAVNHEQSKLLHSGSLEVMIGSVIQSVGYQRLLSDELATPSTIQQLLQLNLDYVGIDKVEALYYDPHTEDYTGQLKILKGWCGSQHAIRKILIMDFIHRLDGTPLWVRHFDNYDDVRDRFFKCREAFLNSAVRPTTKSLIWVFDRGLYSLETLQKIVDLQDHFVTWEKGYNQDGWSTTLDVKCFFRYRSRNNSRDLISYGFEYQESRWARDGSIRRLIVRAKGTVLNRKSVEMSILCSSLSLASEEAIWYMFNRWVQENDLGYLVRNWGIGELTSRAYETYFAVAKLLDDREVVSREHTALQRQRKKSREELGRLLMKRHRSRRVKDTLDKLAKEKTRLESERDQLWTQLLELQGKKPENIPQTPLNQVIKTVKRLKEKFRRHQEKKQEAEERLELEKKITEATEKLDKIETRLAEIPAKESRLKALQEAGYVRLNTARKAFMDSLRMSCRNIFYEASASFRSRYDNYRDDHDRYRALLHSPGILTRHQTGVDICLLPNMDMPPKVRHIIEEFLAKETDAINQTVAEGSPPFSITIRLSDRKAERLTQVKLLP